MNLNYIEMNNIRSYINEKIPFNRGSTLLAGNVGSGKSTVLLATEFALFGISPGELSGHSLLRHGKNKGSVELSFTVNGKEIIIKRNLARKKDRVAQTNGHIVISGTKYDLTPTELKNRIFEILGYPSDLLKAHKSMIFRYTVYTPQENIKAILTCDPDFRLSILRKVFDIDKYKTIIDNTEEGLRNLRSLKRKLEALTKELPQIEEEKKQQEKEIENVSEQIKSFETQEAETKKTLSEKETALKSLEEQFSKNMETKETLTKNKTLLTAKRDAYEKIKKSLEDNEKTAENLKNRVDKIEVTKSKNIEDIQKKISELENKNKEFSSNIAVYSKEVEILRKILEKGSCETCGQKVREPEKFSSNIENKKKQLESWSKQTKEVNVLLEKAREELSKEKENQLKVKQREEFQNMLEKCLKDREANNNDKTKTLEQIKTLENTVSKLEALVDATIEQKVREKRDETDEIKRSISDIEKEKARLTQREEDIRQEIGKICERLEDLHEKNKKLDKVKGLCSWLNDQFVPLISTIEQHVMMALRQEFNVLFQEWFDEILGGELKVSIDDSFAPVVVQNGYEAEYKNLSGGEKTSIALAYRLALNKVINSLIKKISTKDILILDEPTDGFSSDQIENFRNIIEKLGLEQIILVSHENKIESLVENVVRVYKEDHCSRIA